MDKKGFISISVIYTLFILFIVLLLSILVGFINTRILLKIAKGDTNEILADSEDNRQIGIVCKSQPMGACFSSYSNLDYTLVLHDGNLDYATEDHVDYEAGDDAYRYSGGSPFNYVCFGTDTSPCPENNLYRIISITDNKIKIIKDTPLGTKQQWNNTAKNYFPESFIYTYLNGTFLDTFDTTWQQKIANSTWNIGGLSDSHALTGSAKDAYNYEYGDNKTDSTYNAKVGLMNLTDYFYAASPEHWTKNGNNYSSAKNDNWLAGNEEYLLTKFNGVSADSGVTNETQVYKIMSNGQVSKANVMDSFNIRPCFVLYYQVSLVSGIGSKDDPFIIN